MHILKAYFLGFYCKNELITFIKQASPYLLAPVQLEFTTSISKAAILKCVSRFQLSIYNSVWSCRVWVETDHLISNCRVHEGWFASNYFSMRFLASISFLSLSFSCSFTLFLLLSGGLMKKNILASWFFASMVLKDKNKVAMEFKHFHVKKCCQS